MTILDHTRGVIIALAIAIVSIFGLSLMMPSQIVIQEDTVVNLESSNCYDFMKNEQNFPVWMSDLKGLSIIEKDSVHYQYVGADQQLHGLEIHRFDRNSSLELSFFKDGEKLAVFNLICTKAGDQTLVKISQFWHLGINPISKLMGYKMKDKLAEQLKDDLHQLKKALEN